jgi:hypothetical protein
MEVSSVRESVASAQQWAAGLMRPREGILRETQALMTLPRNAPTPNKARVMLSLEKVGGQMALSDVQCGSSARHQALLVPRGNRTAETPLALRLPDQAFQHSRTTRISLQGNPRLRVFNALRLVCRSGKNHIFSPLAIQRYLIPLHTRIHPAVLEHEICSYMVKLWNPGGQSADEKVANGGPPLQRAATAPTDNSRVYCRIKCSPLGRTDFFGALPTDTITGSKSSAFPCRPISNVLSMLWIRCMKMCEHLGT